MQHPADLILNTQSMVREIEVLGIVMLAEVVACMD